MNNWIFQENFFLFGMGNRPKLIFKNHCLFDIQHQTVLACFDERQRAEIHPADYRVDIGKDAVWEDAHGLYLCQGNQVRTLSRENVHLPAFEPHPHAALMRVLHHDLLVSLVDGRPVPNPLVYQAPWYRDAAMMAMALQRTGNLDLMRDWILSLDDPYDRNNKGEMETDNLGQALYLISLVSDRHHPLVQKILSEARLRTKNGSLTGLTDYAPHPVYQTKWLKLGLARLGFEDSWTVPEVEDSYAELFWMGNEKFVAQGEPVSFGQSPYPYLEVAKAHTAHAPLKELPDALQYPVSWEKDASEAVYENNLPYLPWYARHRVGAPHTWHAAELLLYLMDCEKSEG